MLCEHYHMNEDKTNYREIWQAWLKAIPDDPRMDGNELGELLEKSFESYNNIAQQELIETMLAVILNQDYAHETALCILKKKATIEHRRKLHEFYLCRLKLGQTGQDEWYLKMLIDALSYETTDEFVNTIENFLLYRPFVEWATYPSEVLLITHPDLYLRGWTRFFNEKPFKKGKTNIIFQGFLAKPQLILTLKQYMIINAPNAWDKFKTILLDTIDEKRGWPSQELQDKSRQVIVS